LLNINYRQIKSTQLNLKTTLRQKMVLWVGAQGQVTSAKKSRKRVPMNTSPTENPKLGTKFFFQSELVDFRNP